MSGAGYYRYPAILNETIIFVSEGDLWRAELNDLVARRLTFNKGEIKSPVFSPDGKNLAFSSTDEGHSEVYVMPSNGGEMTRLTYMGDDVNLLCWTKEGIYFSSSYGQPFLKWNVVWRVDPKGGVPEQIDIGPANFLSFKKDTLKSGSVIQRHGYREYGYWKRYRGGTAGELWVDAKGTGTYTQLLDFDGDMSRPLWVSDKTIVFGSDHEGIGNLYCCDALGKNLTRLTNHTDYYVRNQASDGKHVIYHAGADLWVLNLKNGKTQKLDIKYYSDRPGRTRKFFSAPGYLQGYDLHPKGHHLALVTRGKAAVMGNWDGPVTQFGEADGIRYRMPCWLHDGKRILVVNDNAGDESFEIYDARTAKLASKPSKKLDIGRITSLFANPKTDTAIAYNHRNDVLFVDLKKWTIKKIDRGENGPPFGGDWSMDGKWFTYATTVNRQQVAIRLFDVKTKKVAQVSKPVLMDEDPIFDPEGKFIYFLSHRHFDPTYDSLHFELSFSNATKVYAIPLTADITSPFLKAPEALFEEPPKEEKGKGKKGKKKDDKPEEPTVKVDLEGIQDRLFEFPIQSGEYSNLCAVKGRIYYLSHPNTGALESGAGEGASQTLLETFDFETQKTDVVAHGVHEVCVSPTYESMLLRYGRRLRFMRPGEKPDEDQTPGKKSGWIDLSRVKLMVDPSAEWHQMYKEAWRLQRDHYWTEDMSDINWKLVFNRYEPLLERISTREEFTDLMWEMQGELGTSHAYAFGGDLKASPHWTVGSLAADFKWDKTKKAYKITRICQGDSWNTKATSPLSQPGVNLQVGDYLYAINKQPLSLETQPSELLFNRAGEVVEIDYAAAKTPKKTKTALVKTLTNQYGACYREWVETNRAYVHKKTKGKVGYIHIPDMSAAGYAEFHRSFLQEVDREGLIVDVRFNGGGHVSQLLLEKLARRRIGYDVTRWHGTIPYPEHAPMGPMVALTNEYAGSDGDMFSHNFKMMNLGPLIGKRTWGGVIGIAPYHGLVDGGMTTQPEYSFWFQDIGWNIENYGVDPDIEVEITPQDYAKGKDPQMERGLKELDKLMKKFNYIAPNVKTKPSLKIPAKLPKAS